MQNLYPLFERNRILKKELMWSLRDYSFTHIQLEYQAYADGMIKGCDLEVRGNELVVGKGIVIWRLHIPDYRGNEYCLRTHGTA